MAGYGHGGGVFVTGSAYLSGCTIDSNSAQFSGGLNQEGNASNNVSIVNSTISGNHVTQHDASVFIRSPVVIENSTVAFNTADVGCSGISVQSSVTLQSTIIAHNSNPRGFCMDMFAYAPVSGGNNLITKVEGFQPQDTISADPQLTPLADHGGPTWTHGLSIQSPAVDHGNNAASVTTDQRGAGFDRVVGVAADIGAFERQVGDDQIFFGGFE